MNREQLIDRLSAAAATLLPPHEVLAAYAYGSRISGRPRPDSDLDVGYYLHRAAGHEGLDLRSEMLLAAELSEAAGVDVDLRHLGTAPLELRGQVLETGVRVYSGDDSERVDLERDLLTRYHDYKDTFRRMRAIRLEQTAKAGF